jgi:hypothetical protein
VRDATFYASGLLELHKLSAADRRASWRQSMAALARAATEDGPGPLEGLHAEALLTGVQAALQAGLADDLDWLAPAAAGAALYELASSLPLGTEQRELGRRVLARMRSADADTFAAIARRLALGGGRGLASPGMRARVALVMELPISSDVHDAPLALALASRRDMAREWIGAPSIGSLPERRFAARLLERAAREASRRASQGDDHSLRVFRGDTVEQAWDRLLADRESLVWRHVAVARGLLAPWVPALSKAIDAALAPSLSPTEWRRAAASISALAAVAPDRALELTDRALSSGLLKRDPGAVAAFVWGLPRAAEAEPDAAAQLFDRVVERAGPEVAESVLELRTELGDTPLTARATEKARALVAARPRPPTDDDAEALSLEVAHDLDGAARSARAAGDDQTVRQQIVQALDAFASAGAKEAHALAREALATAQGSLDALDAVTPEEEALPGRPGAIARRASLSVLRDLDASLLEQNRLAQLLALGGGESARGVEEALDGLRDRVCDWILAREGRPLQAGPKGVGAPAHPTASMQRLRALLHLADGDMGDDESAPARVARLRKRCLRIARALLDRFEHGPPSPVRRTIIAALGRSLDALVRVGACDVVDALLVVASHSVDPADLRTLAEASMDPNLVHVLERYAVFAAAGVGVVPLAAFDELTRDLALDASTRSEALRAVLVRLGAALSALAEAQSLQALVPEGGSEPEVVSSLEAALSALAQLTFGARGRLDPERNPAAPPAAPRPLTIAVTRVLSGADAALADHVIASSLDHLLNGVPTAIRKVVSEIVWRLPDLPKAGAISAPPQSVRLTEALPTWLPARRTIGGFHVVRSLSSGAAGSVFIVTRVEDKAEIDAEKFALKVPEYSASAARSLSEAEFLKLFRDEAGALIALPQHPNLARFVTFDAGSRPKPILVMELVEGTTLEHMLEARRLDAIKALKALDDVLQGLAVMHAVGIGHLDLKPANVVLRRGEEAVLVDFGLAGKHIRPGCATGPYGAPEVWGALDGVSDAAPTKADIYAFGCVAFEAVTGRVLFEADSEMAQIAMHVAHDGFPPALKALAKRTELAPFTELLFSTLRRNPRDRPAATAVRKELARIAPALARAPWPLG